MKVSKHLAVVFLWAFAVSSGGCQSTQPPLQRSMQRLSVAIYKYLPDAAAQMEGFEGRFEAAHPGIDLDLVLWDPYDVDELKQMRRYDVVEIDFVRYHDILSIENEAFGGTDLIPHEARAPAAAYIAPASTLLADAEVQARFVPHWVCGNFLVCWKDSDAIARATSLDQLVAALDPQTAGLLGDFDGKGTLGEHYADAVLDIKGAEFARQHFAQWATNQPPALLPEAFEAVKRLFGELETRHRAHRAHFHDYYNGAFAEAFAKDKAAALIGYSERLYYVERQYIRTPWERTAGAAMTAIDPATIVVKQVPYADRSQGTPAWVDGFVIPKGKLQTNRDAITKFLAFVNSEAGLEPFLVPVSWPPGGSYLMPAAATAYESKAVRENCPSLRLYKDQLADGVVFMGRNVYDGIKKAGAAVDNQLGN